VHAAVVVLSEDFMEKDWPMEELQLVLERHGNMPEKARIVPVFHGSLSTSRVLEKAEEHTLKAGKLKAQGREQQAAQLQQWAADLRVLAGITGVRSDQVCVPVVESCP
jgi:hypothetical protein